GAKPVPGLRRWTMRIGAIVLMLGVAGVTFGLFGVAGLQVALRLREVDVPELAGQTVAEATATLSEAGLAVRVEPLSRIHSTIPAGQVVDQEPLVGQVTRSHRNVKVWLSSGQSAGAVPSLLGQSERGALARLEEDALGLLGVSEIRSGRYASDAVVAQEPPPRGTATAVSVLINRGERGATYVMPDLIGVYASSAADVLRARGFRVTQTDEYPYPDPRVGTGIVLRQFPRPGFQIAHGEAISIEVSQ
ncbi:MAG: PASTA domain-containing protein, partial [bacterium]